MYKFPPILYNYTEDKRIMLGKIDNCPDKDLLILPDGSTEINGRGMKINIA